MDQIRNVATEGKHDTCHWFDPQQQYFYILKPRKHAPIFPLGELPTKVIEVVFLTRFV